MAYTSEFTYEQYKEIRQFWIDTYNDQISFFGHPIWLKPFWVFDEDTSITAEFLKTNTQDLDYYKDKSSVGVWHTDTSQGIWLIKNCNLEYVQEEHRSFFEADELELIDKLDLAQKSFIVNIKCGDTRFDFYTTDGTKEFYEPHEVTPLTKLMVYGDTTFLYVWDEVQKVLRKELSGINRERLKDVEVEFYLFGLQMFYKNGHFYDESGVKSPYFDQRSLDGWVLPKVKYSLDLNDIITKSGTKFYNRNEILVSRNAQIFSLHRYGNLPKNNGSAVLWLVSDVIRTHIKKSV